MKSIPNYPEFYDSEAALEYISAPELAQAKEIFRGFFDALMDELLAGDEELQMKTRTGLEAHRLLLPDNEQEDSPYLLSLRSTLQQPTTYDQIYGEGPLVLDRYIDLSRQDISEQGISRDRELLIYHLRRGGLVLRKDMGDLANYRSGEGYDPEAEPIREPVLVGKQETIALFRFIESRGLFKKHHRKPSQL